MEGKRLVVVEWLDSGRSPDWHLVEDIEPQIIRCRSVGWLVAETDEYLHVAPHVGEEPAQACGGMTIPRCAVIQTKDLSITSS